MICSDAHDQVQYRALTVGPAAAAAFSSGEALLCVHSVFPSTLNLQMVGTDQVVALTGPRGAAYPHAVTLEHPGDFRDWMAVPLGQASLREGWISLPSPTRSLRVDLRAARRLPARPMPWIARTGGAYRACVARLSTSQASSACALEWTALVGGRRAKTALGSGLCTAALNLGHAAGAFLHSVGGLSAGPGATGGPEARAPESLNDAVAALVGLGTGLTPSGDDFLCGFLAAARGQASGSTRILGDLVDRLSEAMLVNLERTGRTSALLIRWAVQNQWPRPLVDLAEALAREEEGDALWALGNLVQLGHSSGSDLATGFLFGLATLAAPAAETLVAVD